MANCDAIWLKEEPACVLDAGHEGYHQHANGTEWRMGPKADPTEGFAEWWDSAWPVFWATTPNNVRTLAEAAWRTARTKAPTPASAPPRPGGGG